MFVSIFQSLTALLLAGVFFYAIFAFETLRRRKRLQQVLIGVVLGGLVVTLGLHPYMIQPRNVPLDASAGPLIFAGYLGGPIGACVTAVFAVGLALYNSGPIPALGVFIVLAIIGVGLLVSYLRPSPTWPEIPRNAAVLLLLLFPIPFLVPILTVGAAIPAENAYQLAAITAGHIVAVGLVAILLTWLILNYAYFFASEAIRSAELAKRLNLVLDQSGMGLWDYTLGATESHYDATTLAMLGLDEYEPGMVPTAAWQERVHPEDRHKVQDKIRQGFAGGIPHDRVDYRILYKDGNVGFIRAYWKFEYDDTGRPVRVIGVHTDTTNIRRMEQAHQDTLVRIAQISENLPGVLFQTDVTDPSNPHISYVSPKCVEIWGYTDKEFYNDPDLFERMHDPEDLPIFLELLRKCVKSGEPISHSYKITDRDGAARWLDFRGGIVDTGGKRYLEAIVLDATAEVEMQQQIEAEREISYRVQKSESIGQLTGGVAHDFNNLLAVIVGNLELLTEEDDPAMRQELIDASLKAALRGANLTKSLLAFARKARLSPEDLDLNAVLTDAGTWMNRAVPESVSIETALPQGVWPVTADRSSLESALLNLIVNARDAMKGKGKLTIETENIQIDDTYMDARSEALAPGRYVMLAVSDTGEGIPEDIRSQIFEPFFTTKPPGSGSGLGLSMVLGFMRQSGGTVQVYSEPGLGTTFKLFFPAAKSAKALIEAQAAPTKPAKGLGQRILLAEDEAAVSNTLVQILTRAGYDVTPAGTGDAAFAMFDADPTFDLLLTDIVMPGELQGTHLAKALRLRWPDLPVIFMSGYASEATVHGNGLRPDDIRLMKPVQRADLLAAIAQALSTSAGTDT